MKEALWTECSATSIHSQILNLQQVEANLVALPTLEDERGKIVIALSFVRQAMKALAQTSSGADRNA